jgi:EAL and modified HD-GYP domain-containing signal transduction protein
MEKAFVGRQPIYRDGVEVFAYELFSRNNELTQAAFAKGDTVTAEALLHDFIDVGLERVVGPHPAFVKVNRDFILNDYPWLLPKNGVVLQIPGDTAPDAALLKSLSQLTHTGYSIALSDFVYRHELRPLAEMADIIKLNIRSLDRATISEQAQALRPLDVKLLAEEVETYEEYQQCKDAGFEYFEGYFFCKPQVKDSQTLPSNKLSTLHLLSKLQDPDISLGELERAVAQDVAMSYRILRYLNSPINALPRKVESLRHAISLVGTNLIRRWASVIWLESIEDKPRELMIMAMVRAHMCQQLGVAVGSKAPDQFFTVGLLSLIDALLDRPMDKILQDLPLIEPVKDALIARTGVMGTALNCVQAYERCDWERTTCDSLDEKKIREAYLSSVAWSRAVIHELVN